MSETTPEIGSETIDENQELAGGVGVEDTVIKEDGKSNGLAMVDVEAMEGVTATEEREEKTENEGGKGSPKEISTVSDSQPQAEENSSAVVEESASPNVGEGENRTTDSLNESTDLLENGAPEATRDENGREYVLKEEVGGDAIVAAGDKQENGGSTVENEVEDSRMSPEDSIPQAQAKKEGPLESTAGEEATTTASATAETLADLKASPDGQFLPVMPELLTPKHVKKGEVLKRPQHFTTVVTRNGKTWNEMCDALVAYKQQHGNCYVPDRYKDEDGVCLGLWVRNQRRREDSLTDEQHQRLTELGLDWQTQNERFDNVWHERYARLTMYRVENGDCKVPYTYRADPALAKWVSQQRAQQSQGRLAPERKAKLDAIDFSWKLNTVKNRNTKTEDTKWTKQYDKLVSFHERHGHCKVPDRYKPDRPLGTWVKKQRLAHACNQLKDDRKKLLDDLGFVWRITDKTDGEKWEHMFCKLQEYKEENGTCHVSRTVPDGELKPLARWVKTQRALYKSGKILPDRKERLESIDFVWDGTQLPIKRKRRRLTEEMEKDSSIVEMATNKRAKTDDADFDKKPSVEDAKAPEKKLVAKRVLPTSSLKADTTKVGEEEAMGVAALKEMADDASPAQGKHGSTSEDQDAIGGNAFEARTGEQSYETTQPTDTQAPQGETDEARAATTDQGTSIEARAGDETAPLKPYAPAAPVEPVSPMRRSSRQVVMKASQSRDEGESTEEECEGENNVMTVTI